MGCICSKEASKDKMDKEQPTCIYGRVLLVPPPHTTGFAMNTKTPGTVIQRPLIVPPQIHNNVPMKQEIMATEDTRTHSSSQGNKQLVLWRGGGVERRSSNRRNSQQPPNTNVVISNSTMVFNFYHGSNSQPAMTFMIAGNQEGFPQVRLNGTRRRQNNNSNPQGRSYECVLRSADLLPFMNGNRITHPTRFKQILVQKYQEVWTSNNFSRFLCPIKLFRLNVLEKRNEYIYVGGICEGEGCGMKYRFRIKDNPWEYDEVDLLIRSSGKHHTV